MAATVVDTGYIAASYSIPEPTIQTLLESPTTEHIKDLLQKIEEKAREHESIQAEKLRSDVELETAVRNGNARAKQLKESVDKGLKEVEELRRKLSSEETTRASVESELQTLKSSSSSSSSEAQALQSRIASLEASNRDALALLESKSIAHDKLAEELSIQQQKIVALRREVSELEEKRQAAENASISSKFREQNLQQEVELLKRNNDWHEEELKRRSGEHTKYRKEKGAQIAELQRLVEDTAQANETLRSTETKLRNHLDDVTRKLEDAFVQIQAKEEDAVKREESFRAERDNALRLAELQKKSAETARARQQELERLMEQLREDAATEIGNLQADITAERGERENAEQRIAELELRIESLQSDLAAAQQVPSLPTTPRRGVNGFGAHGTPGRPGSPGLLATPGGTRLKGSLTVTQIYSEYSKLKAELDSERRRSEELSTEMDNMIQDLENKQPQIEEMRMDHDRLKGEVEELAALLEQANSERDVARKAARKWEGIAEGRNKEADLHRQQLRDLSAQVKILLVEVQAREQGLQALSAAEQSQLEQLARGELDEGALEGMSDTGRFISQRLVIFRGVKELQEQNQKLLNLTRRLGEEMEGEEAKAKRNQQERDQEELENLRTRLSEYQDHIQSLTTRSESYIRERDMFRRMLAHRGHLPAGTDLAAVFGQSVDGSAMPATPSRSQSVDPSTDARALADHVKLVKEMQQHFDSYREEAATDHASLKQQVDQLSRQKSELQGENARVSSQLTLAHERYELLQSNYSMLRTENGELQKRSQVLSENAAKQDIRTQQVAEELVEAKALADSMRNETANLKAERELWKRIEARLTDDNQSLMDERSRLNKMVSDLQSLQNERELADSETRRRLQTRVETLESELSAAKRKLDDEVEQGKKAALRREYEQEQNRTRIEDLLKSSANYKEELVAAKTQRDQLQARVDELKIELRNAEEKTQALQPRLTSRPTGGDSQETDENALTREQELSVEVADLKRDLQLKQSEFQQAQEEIEQYKAIAQSVEESLQNINETNDLFREETDQTIAEKDAKIQDLEQRVNEISSELATTNSELSEVRAKQEESSSKLADQKSLFETEIARLRDESERLAETARLHQEDLKAQANIAQQAQTNYDDELIKHADAASSLQRIRNEYNQLKTEVAGFKAEAEAAKISLAQNEESWAETRNRYEKEITELKNRREDVNSQNRRLHQQLEEVSSQIASLKQVRAAAGDDVARAGSPEVGSPADNLQEIIRYLRQEKEIVDMQYELSIQESKRLKQQLDHSQSQLDQTREKLEQERQSQVDREQNATSHAKLMQTINELNLFRESNTSLRNEARSAQEQLAKKTKEVEDLLVQIEPLQTRVRELEHELESREGEVKLLQEDRDRWQKRTQDIMQKYDRVDPAELEGLRNQISSLQAERDSLLSEKSPMQEEIDQLRLDKEEQERIWKERRANIVEQAKAKAKEQNTIIKEHKTQLEAVSAELARVTEELGVVKEELERTKTERDEAQTQAAQQVASSEPAEEGQVDEGAQSSLSDNIKAEFENQIATAEARASNEAERASSLEQELQTLQARIQQLEEQLKDLQQSLEAANAQISTLQNTQESQDGASREELERLQRDLTAAQQEIETLRNNAVIAASVSQTTPDGSKSVAEQVQEQVEQLRQGVVSQEEEKFQKRAEKMREQYTTKLAQRRQAIEAQAKKEQDEAIQRLKEEHNNELQRTKNEAGVPMSDALPTNESSASSTDAPDTKPSGGWKPSQAEITELLTTNPDVKKIVAGNVRKKIEQEKEVLAAQIKQEDEKIWAAKIEEVNKAAEAAKAKAIAAAEEMAAKKGSVKLNMIENRLKTAQAQVEVVKQAANTTPQRPVGEVWAIAKDTKGVVVPRPGQPATAPQVPATPKPQPNQQVQPPQPAIVQQPNQTQVSQPPQNQVPSSQTSTPNPFLSRQSSGPSASNPFGQPSGPGSGRGAAPNPFAPTQNVNQQVPVAAAQNQQPASAQPQIRPPSQPAGTGPAALRNIVGQAGAPSSGIPRPGGGPAQRGRGRGGHQQQGQNHHQQQQQQQQGQQQDISVAGAARGGSNLPRGPGARGGGRGGGRGQVQTSGLPQQGGSNSPGGGRGAGPLNPGARQFIPGGAGNKRPHEGGDGGSAEKRVKEGE